ncbi:hypothetical protein ABZS71_32565 [Streptomyces sp. NPDC005393]|uniref:hypothetical protein n=1 Tax=Streptomyces sp. NPDC005393 TaxID=3157041 RepID=UPI0033A7DA04
MADPQSNARPRADAGAPTSGVIHVRTRLTADFTVIANALAQRRGSAVTIGVAAYILSLPDGAPVSIAALCEHFTEGEILISRALRELEDAGYLERRRERGPGGVIRTRTYFYDIPRWEVPTPPPPTPPRPRRPLAEETPARTPAGTRGTDAAPDAAPASTTTGPAPAPVADPEPGAPPTHETRAAPTATPLSVPPPQPPSSLAEADEQAVAILASLRIADPRLILSRREVAELAPAVTQWLAAGVGPAQITAALTGRLPDQFLARPSRILRFRLSEPPLAVPAPAALPSTPAVLPWQTCDGCERAFRAAEPGRCRDCRAEGEMPAATASGEVRRAAG